MQQNNVCKQIFYNRDREPCTNIRFQCKTACLIYRTCLKTSNTTDNNPHGNKKWQQTQFPSFCVPRVLMYVLTNTECRVLNTSMSDNIKPTGLTNKKPQVHCDIQKSTSAGLYQIRSIFKTSFICSILTQTVVVKSKLSLKLNSLTLLPALTNEARKYLVTGLLI